MPVPATLNLTFHGIGEPPAGTDDAEREVWVSRDSFLAVLDLVRDREQVSITFDDGNLSDVKVALPALVERGMTAQFFIAAGRLESADYLSPDDLRRLVQAGMEIGSHGMDHRPWRGLSAAEAEEEFVAARQRLESEVGAPMTAAACPFGAYDRRSLNGLRRAGFTRIFSSDGGFASSSAWLQPRTTLLRDSGPATVERLLARGPARSLTRRAKTLAKRWR